MRRKPQFTLTVYPPHIIQRGLDRQACIFAATDCRLYLALLAGAAASYDCHLHAYVPMSNQAHLLATPQQLSDIPDYITRLSVCP